jgi:tRNA A37 N6-isopentenylltransferase MiaA
MDAAIEKIKMESRRYAKRQLTWLRRDDEIEWITWGDDPDVDCHAVCKRLAMTLLGI